MFRRTALAIALLGCAHPRAGAQHPDVVVRWAAQATQAAHAAPAQVSVEIDTSHGSHELPVDCTTDGPIMLSYYEPIVEFARRELPAWTEARVAEHASRELELALTSQLVIEPRRDSGELRIVDRNAHAAYCFRAVRVGGTTTIEVQPSPLRGP